MAKKKNTSGGKKSKSGSSKKSGKSKSNSASSGKTKGAESSKAAASGSGTQKTSAELKAAIERARLLTDEQLTDAPADSSMSWSNKALSASAADLIAMSLPEDLRNKSLTDLDLVQKGKTILETNLNKLLKTRISLSPLVNSGITSKATTVRTEATVSPAFVTDGNLTSGSGDTVVDGSGNKEETTAEDVLKQVSGFFKIFKDNFEKYRTSADSVSDGDDGSHEPVRNDFTVIGDFSLPYHLEDDCGCGAGCDEETEENYLRTIDVAPVGRDDFAFTRKGQALHIWPQLNDKPLFRDELTVDEIENGTTIDTGNGIAVGIKTWNGQDVYAFQYTPNKDFVGTDSFEYTVRNKVNRLDDKAMVFVRVVEIYTEASLAVVDEAGANISDFCNTDDTNYTITVDTGGRPIDQVSVKGDGVTEVSAGSWTFTPFHVSPRSFNLELVDTTKADTDPDYVLATYGVNVADAPVILDTTHDIDISYPDYATFDPKTNTWLILYTARMNTSSGTYKQWVYNSRAYEGGNVSMYVKGTRQQNGSLISNEIATAEVFSGNNGTGCYVSASHTFVQEWTLIAPEQPMPHLRQNWVYVINDTRVNKERSSEPEYRLLASMYPDFDAKMTSVNSSIESLRRSRDVTNIIQTGLADSLMEDNMNLLESMQSITPGTNESRIFYDLMRNVLMNSLHLASLRNSDIDTFNSVLLDMYKTIPLQAVNNMQQSETGALSTLDKQLLNEMYIGSASKPGLQTVLDEIIQSIK